MNGVATTSMQTFIVKVSGVKMNATDIRETIWASNPDIKREDLLVLEI